MAPAYDYGEDEASQQSLQNSNSQDLGYDPNFVPDSVKTFVVHLYRHIREKNVYEIHQMYEGSFQKLSDRMFKESPWPSVDAIAPYVDNDHVFCLLYREMWYRHLYARLAPTPMQRIESWDNYCSLFQVVLHGVVNMQLPNQWLWDMVDEFVYQFQSYCQYRAKMKSKTEQEIALLRQYDQLDIPQKNHSVGQVAWYGYRWIFCLLLMEVMTHLFYYNALATSGLWRQLSPLEVFIIGYGVLNFMWLKFLLIWRYFRFWSLVGGIETPENMPKCINNCYNLDSFWKNWHASFNKWLVRYMYIPLGGSQRKLLNVWVIFTFVAIWHDLEWKLLSWAWLTCLFFIPEIIAKSAVTAFQAKNAAGEFFLRELNAVAGAITITCLVVANLVGFVMGPSGINWLISRLLQKDGLPILGGIFTTFYVGTKLMFHIQDSQQNSRGI